MINDELNDSAEQDNQPSLRETLFPYIRQIKWYIISIIIFLALGYVYATFQVPFYEIETALLIKDNKGSKGGQNDLLKDLDLFTSDKIIDNEILILESKTLLKKVSEALKLQTSYVFEGRLREKEAYFNIPFEVELLVPYKNAYKTKLFVQLVNAKQVKVNDKLFATNTPIQTEAGMIMVKPTNRGVARQILRVNFNDIADVIQDYSSRLKIDPVSKQATSLVIKLEDAIPQRGEDFLNRLVEEYNNAALEDKNQETSKTLTFITDRLNGIAAELSSVEKNVERFKSTNRITDISAQSQAFLQSVQDNDVQLNRVLIQIGVLKSMRDYLDKSGDSAVLPSLLGIEDPTLLGLVSKLGEFQLKKQSLLQTVPETNPLVGTLNDQINTLKTAISKSVDNLNTGLEVTRRQLQRKNTQFESVITQVPSKERGLLDVMRQQEIKNNLFTYLLQKREETAMQLASGVADSRTIDPATSSPKPVKPIKNLIYLLFFAAGVILPTLIIYLRGLLNFKINRKQDIERVTKVPILTEVSHSDESDPLLVVARPRSMVAEQLRALRTNLQFVIPNEDQKVILFTSSMSGEGKSFISLNLGASLAMAGKKVVILELDLRKPKLHAGLGIENDLGLSNYLIGKVAYEDVIKPISLQEGYYIITSGPIPPNPAELLVNGRIGKLISQLKEDFDYVILDAPPVGLVTDAQILGIYAEATMFIVRHNYTAKAQIHAINNFYQNKKFKNLNIILNSIDLESGYGYGYSYGYGGYYQEEQSDKKSKGFIGKMFK